MVMEFESAAEWVVRWKSEARSLLWSKDGRAPVTVLDPRWQGGRRSGLGERKG